MRFLSSVTKEDAVKRAESNIQSAVIVRVATLQSESLGFITLKGFGYDDSGAEHGDDSKETRATEKCTRATRHRAGPSGRGFLDLDHIDGDGEGAGSYNADGEDEEGRGEHEEGGREQDDEEEEKDQDGEDNADEVEEEEDGEEEDEDEEEVKTTSSDGTGSGDDYIPPSSSRSSFASITSRGSTVYGSNDFHESESTDWRGNIESDMESLATRHRRRLDFTPTTEASSAKHDSFPMTRSVPSPSRLLARPWSPPPATANSNGLTAAHRGWPYIPHRASTFTPTPNITQPISTGPTIMRDGRSKRPRHAGSQFRSGAPSDTSYLDSDPGFTDLSLEDDIDDDCPIVRKRASRDDPGLQTMSVYSNFLRPGPSSRSGNFMSIFKNHRPCNH
jgi:hypothetical protein